MAIETGQTYRSVLEVRDEDGSLVTPSTSAYTVTLPDQTTAAGSVSVLSLGHLAADYATTMAGLHRGKWVTTVPGIPKTDWFNVTEYRSLLSLDEAREYLGQADTSRDEVIRSMLGGITRLIERYIGTCAARTVTGEFIPGDIRDMIRLPSGPALSATAVTSIVSVWSGGPAWATADVFADGTDVYPADGTSFTGGPWRATYTAGRAVIPDDVLEGAKMALWDLWAVQRGISADQLEPTLQETADYETSFPSGWRLPPRVMQMLDGEHVPGFA
jgi:hypothetical protein